MVCRVARDCSAAGRETTCPQNLVVASAAFLNLNPIIVDPILFLCYIGSYAGSYTRSYIRIEAIGEGSAMVR